MHFVDNLSVKPIKVGDIDSATFTEEQTAFCGEKLFVKSRKEFATHVNGYGVVTCLACLEKIKERINKPWDCENCGENLSIEDTNALTPMDHKRVCLTCRRKGKHFE